MPLPIKPVHSLDLHAELFDAPSMEGLGLSDIQIQMLGIVPTKKEASIKLSENYLSMLKMIDKNTDEVVTAANSIVNNKDGKVCNVPSEISDNQLLALKTAGLISGYGRSVSLTEKAKLALRDHYLSTETTNEFRKARSKDKFDLNEARSVKVSSTKFRKVAGWLNNDKFRDEFDVILLANDDESRARGLMHTKPLKDSEVAFFIFPYEDSHSFWNKNVDYPLSLAFLDAQKCIVDFKDMEMQSTDSCSPNSNNIKYVVEAKKDTFKNNNINLGDKFLFKNNKLLLKREN